MSEAKVFICVVTAANGGLGHAATWTAKTHWMHTFLYLSEKCDSFLGFVANGGAAITTEYEY